LGFIEAAHDVPIITRKQVRVYIKSDADSTVAELVPIFGLAPVESGVQERCGANHGT
jgi:hypothetical protein